MLEGRRIEATFLSDPHAVLAEHGMDVPEGMNVKVVENTGNTVHVTLPAAPDANGDLSDEELENVAGGGLPYRCNSGLIVQLSLWLNCCSLPGGGRSGA